MASSISTIGFPLERTAIVLSVVSDGAVLCNLTEDTPASKTFIYILSVSANSVALSNSTLNNFCAYDVKVGDQIEVYERIQVKKA